MTAGIEIDFSFWFLVFKRIAKTTPVWAKEAPIVAARIGSYFNTARLFSAIGTSPQCKPKITNTCQNPPIRTPAATELKLYTDNRPCPSNVPAHVEIGPITINASGTRTNKVKNGTKNVLTTLGTTFLKKFSSLAPT
ncbi:hypothetical protein D3C77_566070 [compost metagenome]